MTENKVEISCSLWEKMFNQVFTSAQIGMAILDKNGNFVKVNPAFCKLLGYTNYELANKNWKDITHPEDILKSANYTDSYTDKPPEYTTVLEKRYITSTGKTVFCQITTTVINTNENEFFYFVTQIQNLTTVIELRAEIEKIRDFVRRALDRMAV